MKFNSTLVTILIILIVGMYSCGQSEPSRLVQDFNDNWSFHLGEISEGHDPALNHSEWRTLDLPHDWSIEGEFSPHHPATPGGGALPGGIGWYRKTFIPDLSLTEKKAFIQFDGIYMNSQVWINGNLLGERPFGYASMEYDITPYIQCGKENVIAVKVDNSQQPNSRWYSGSGIYRNTRLIYTTSTYIPQWGTFVTTPEITSKKAVVQVATKIVTNANTTITLISEIIDQDGSTVLSKSKDITAEGQETLTVDQRIEITNPKLWGTNSPNLYTLLSKVVVKGNVTDTYETKFGIRDFEFDNNKGLILNGQPLKIRGVCLHHDLGALGTAINHRAIERQIEIMKNMGINAIRTAHNPPAPEFLDLCDQMGIIVMNETFDIWSKNKSPHDYAFYWDDWHEQDLTDHILRDRNHPSVFIWSIGNEILDQWSPEGTEIAKKLAGIVKRLDPSRPITAAMNPPTPTNSIAASQALDLIGYNYHHNMYTTHKESFRNTPFIATETGSTLATRGYYDKKSDTIMRWPIRWDIPFDQGNQGNTVSAYDQVSPPWGSTHEETLPIIENNDFMSGMFIWTGFDYLGEPTPYSWPSRSSYFGIVDLAGFPKDSYYLYQSQWTDKDVLHLFPHWNWTDRDSLDVWAYHNADEVELFINGNSQGVKKSTQEVLHAMWRVKYEPGELKAISRKKGQIVLQQIIETAGDPAKLKLSADRTIIEANGNDLSFITVEVMDKAGVYVPTANDLIEFSIDGEGKIVGVDNGDPTSHLSLKGNKMKAFNGKCLVIVQSSKTSGTIQLTASSGFWNQNITIQSRD
ncbi:MAG: DUF4982 domain-containing protein [Cyclobacteriaceae bacterium]